MGTSLGSKPRNRWLPVLLVVLATASTVSLATTADAVVGIEAAVIDVDVPVEERSYDTFAPDGTPTGTTQWRVASDTGNCCENYLSTTPDGRILDFGGTYPYLSDDAGQTWQRVEPVTPLVQGEGTISPAPNGDIVGIGWDPYSGDHLQAFKYDAEADQWLTAEQPLHSPFFDREWVAVVPGPVLVDGEEVPYAVILRGGYPSKDLYYISGDGLTYTEVSNKQLDSDTLPPRTDVLAPTVTAFEDYGQVALSANLTPLGEASIMTGPDLLTGVDACGNDIYVAGQDLQWQCYQPTDTEAVLWRAVDSSGRLHAMTWSPGDGSLQYLTSPDGGTTVQASAVPLPEGFQVLGSGQFDVKANAAAGIVALTAHAVDISDEQNAPSQDFVFVYRLQGDEPPALERIHEVGLGDLPSGIGVASSSERFDFSTLAILPDGRIAVSFLDSEHTNPAVAVMMSAPEPPASEEPSEEPSQEPAPEPSATASPEPSPSPSPRPSPAPEPTPTEAPEAPREAAVDRVSGDGRIETAVEISRQRADAADSVVVARADVYADALAGAPVAADLDAPILLTPSDELAGPTAAEIERLGARRVLLLGGRAAISEDVADELRAAGVAVSRIGGENRYDTAALLAAALLETGTGARTRAFVVEGAHADPDRGWPDAVSAGPYAAYVGAPILLATQDGVPPETLQALDDQGVTETIVVGGPAALGDDVVAALEQAGSNPRRLAGDTRYETSVEVRDEAITAGMDASRLWLATGRNWTDALTVGPTVAALGDSMLLVDGQRLAGSEATRAALTEMAGTLDAVHIVGGPAAISDEVAAEVRTLVRGTSDSG